MLNITIDRNYHNYDGISYYSYEHLLHTPVKKALDNILSDIDATKLYKGKQIIPTNCWRYEDLVERYIRLLFTIPLYDYVLYNNYVDLLLQRHKDNLDFEALYKEPQPVTKSKAKTSKKKKVPNMYVRSETHNVFTGEVMYDYTNFATGDSFVSDNPNLLDELNAPKKKKKEPKKDFGKIILNFKMK